MFIASMIGRNSMCLSEDTGGLSAGRSGESVRASSLDVTGEASVTAFRLECQQLVACCRLDARLPSTAGESLPGVVQASDPGADARPVGRPDVVPSGSGAWPALSMDAIL